MRINQNYLFYSGEWLDHLIRRDSGEVAHSIGVKCCTSGSF